MMPPGVQTLWTSLAHAPFLTSFPILCTQTVDVCCGCRVVLCAEDQLMRALYNVSQSKAQTPAQELAAAVAGAAAAEAAGPSGRASSSSQPAAAGTAGGLGKALLSVAGVVALPFTRESAKQRLRQELSGARAGVGGLGPPGLPGLCRRDLHVVPGSPTLTGTSSSCMRKHHA
jgi:hypothetical protein